MIDNPCLLDEKGRTQENRDKINIEIKKYFNGIKTILS